MDDVKHLFIIGSQKSGTTYLANLLLQHPELALFGKKEIDFFSRYFDKGVEWYHQNVDDINKIYLDASTSYSAAPISQLDIKTFKENNNPYYGVPRRIFENTKNSKFIYIMRDPVLRTYASYWHQVRAGTETRDFMTAIKEDNYYLRQGKYYKQLQQYLTYFDKDSFLLLSFEEFVKQPEMVVKECFEFLGLKPHPVNAVNKGKNQSFQYGGIWKVINQITGSYGGINRIAKIVRPFVPDSLVYKIGNKMTKKIPSMNDDEMEYLINYFREENKILKDKLGFDISKWKV